MRSVHLQVDLSGLPGNTRVQVHVEEVLKGTVQGTASTASADKYSRFIICSELRDAFRTARTGDQYLIFASRNKSDGTWWSVNFCGDTTLQLPDPALLDEVRRLIAQHPERRGRTGR